MKKGEVGSEGFSAIDACQFPFEPPILRAPGADPTKLDHEPFELLY